MIVLEKDRIYSDREVMVLEIRSREIIGSGDRGKDLERLYKFLKVDFSDTFFFLWFCFFMGSLFF